jgi:hypothetical protein
MKIFPTAFIAVACFSILTGCIPEVGEQTQYFKVACWHDPDYRGSVRPQVPEDRRFSDFDVADSLMCGIGEDRLLRCWGRPDSTRNAGAPLIGQEAIDVSLSSFGGCIVTPEGQLKYWGYNKKVVPSNDGDFSKKSWTKVISGLRKVCAVDQENFVTCWGEDMGRSAWYNDIVGKKIDHLDFEGVHKGCWSLKMSDKYFCKSYGDMVMTGSRPVTHLRITSAGMCAFEQQPIKAICRNPHRDEVQQSVNIVDFDYAVGGGCKIDAEGSIKCGGYALEKKFTTGESNQKEGDYNFIRVELDSPVACAAYN